MKPHMFAPPAQAEALYDTQGEGRDDACTGFRLNDRVTCQPWRDGDSADDSLFYRLPSGSFTGRPQRETPSFGPAQ